MRKHARNWLMKVILGIIIIVFVFYFGSMRGSLQTETIAKIDGLQIARAEYIKEYQDLIDFYRQRYGNSISDDLLKKLNLKQRAYDSLIERMIILAKADELGLEVSDEEVTEKILSYPAFKRDGVFDPSLYERILAFQKITPEEFEDSQRRFLTINKLERLIKESAKVSDEEAYEIYRMQNEKINLDFVKITPDAFIKGVNPTDEDLKNFLKEKAENFRVPRQIKLEYIRIPGADFAQSHTVTKDEIEEYYRYHKEDFTKKVKVMVEGKEEEKAEPAPLEEVRDTIIDSIQQTKGMEKAFMVAKKAHDIIYQEENFHQYAEAQGLKVAETDLFSEENPPKELLMVADLFAWAFDLQEGEISPVLSDDKAHYIFRLTGEKASYIPALEEARKEIEQSYRESESIKRAKERAEGILARLKKGDLFLRVADEEGLKWEETGLFKPSQDIPKIGFSSDLFGAVYELSIKTPYPETVFYINGSYVVVRLKERGTINNEEWEKAKEGLKTSLLNFKKEDYFRSWLEETRKMMTKEGRIEILKEVEDI